MASSTIADLSSPRANHCSVPYRMLFCIQAVENLIVRVICAHHSPRYKSCPHATLQLKTPRNDHRMRVFPGSSTVEHSAVNNYTAEHHRRLEGGVNCPSG